MIKVNGEEIEFSVFPNNETLVNTAILNKIHDDGPIRIDFKYYEDKDILHLYFVLCHIRALCNNLINLYIYYMPYSRMDRYQNGNCFTLKHVIQLLANQLDACDKVFIVEPHSDVSLDWYNSINCECINVRRINVITPLMNKILREHPEINVICYPDAGAMKRFKDDEVKLPVVYCNKVRDFDTGEIKGLELIKDKELDLTGLNVLILDDLSSKGGTFYYTSLKLKEAGANKVFLGICHCESSIREGKIYENPDENDVRSPIAHIYCMDTMLLEYRASYMTEHSNVTVFKIEEFTHPNKLVSYLD